MNCKESRLLIAGLTGVDLPDALAAHVEDCPACAGLLHADARLRSTLRSYAPLASPSVLGRVRAEIADSRPRSRFGLLRKSTLMKITVPALSALLVATALVALPHPADAATPLATFAKMKRALLAQAKTMTQLDVKLGKKPDGSVGTWVLVDGDLVEPGKDGSFHSTKDGKNITVMTSLDHPDLSRFTPAQRAQIEKAIKDAMRGKGTGGVEVVTNYVVDGKRVSEKEGKAALKKHGIDLSISLDLDEGDYRTIAFGADRDHLVLSPKAAKDRRYVVALDPKTSLPKNVLLQRQDKGKWVLARRSNVTLR